MLKFRFIYRVKRVFEPIGKPLFWLLISPIVVFISLIIDIRNIQQTTSAKKQKINRKKTEKLVRAQHTSIFYFLIRIFKTKHLLRRKTKAKVIQKKPQLQQAKKKEVPKSVLFLQKHVTISRIYFALFIFSIISIVSFGSYWFYTNILKDLPTPKDLIEHQPIVTTKIFDRNHVLLYKIFKNENRTVVPLKDLPQSLIDATVSIEDKDFFQHKGLAFKGILRALRADLSHEKIQGGSTITQQLIKNTLLTSQRTFTRKIKEIILALQVEAILSKNQILEMYLNQVSYGGSAYGVEEASIQYFGKSAKDLDLAQSAFLAGLPAAPSLYTPWGSDPNLGIQRQHDVLKRMVEDKKITQSQASDAESEKLVFRTDQKDIIAPHFVLYVKSLLAKEYGEEALSQGGLEVTTSLDVNVQKTAELAVATELAKLKGLHVGNGAALVTNPKSGEILAMVGSKDYFNIKDDGQVNVTIRPRQPGSSIKPLMYVSALQQGFTPTSIIDDSPVVYTIPGSPPWSPKNYDGKFHGKVTLRTALASSYNVPAVKTLAAIGVTSMVNSAHHLGITTWNDPSRFNLTLTLGSNEVLMTDMAKAYGTFSNLGQTVSLNPILEVKNYKGEIFYQNPCNGSTSPCNGTLTVDPGAAYQITDILSDNDARANAFGLHSVLTIPNQMVAVKTGTTNSLRDNWTIGYTTDRLVATWVGNNDNSPMSSVTSGITGASPIWNIIMRSLLDASHPHVFEVPPTLISTKLCRSTGQPVCAQLCPGVYTEYFLPQTAPSSNCIASQPDPSPSVKTFTYPKQLSTGNIN